MRAVMVCLSFAFLAQAAVADGLSVSAPGSATAGDPIQVRVSASLPKNVRVDHYRVGLYDGMSSPVLNGNQPVSGAFNVTIPRSTSSNWQVYVQAIASNGNPLSLSGKTFFYSGLVKINALQATLAPLPARVPAGSVPVIVGGRQLYRTPAGQLITSDGGGVVSTNGAGVVGTGGSSLHR